MWVFCCCCCCCCCCCDCIRYESPLPGGTAFTSLDVTPPVLFRMIGENREADLDAAGIAILTAILSAFCSALTCVARALRVLSLRVRRCVCVV